MTTKARIAALIALRDEDGHIEPDDLIAAARHPKHPHHNAFEWDDKKAARQCRMDTAREIIRAYRLTIIIEDIEVSSVGYVADPNRPAKSRRYVDLTVAARNSEVSKQILLAEIERIIAGIRRAKEIALVLGMKSHFDLLLRDIEKVQARTKKVGPRKKSRGPKPRGRTAPAGELRV